MSTLNQSKDTVQAAVDEVGQHLNKGIATLQDKAEEAKGLTHQALAKLPAPMAGRIEGLTEAVRQRPVLAAAVVLGVSVLLLLRGLLRRSG